MDLLKLMVELLFDCSWFDETCDGIVLIKSVINKYKNHYYANIFLGKGSYKDKSDTKSFLLININNECLYIINTIF